MDKFVYLTVLVAVVVLGSATFAAASPIRALVPKAAKVVSGIPATIGKVGDGVSNWLWRNKGTVATAMSKWQNDSSPRRKEKPIE